ncbi:hypothetical protein CDL12_11888 [Handroanthus impetiginosus]|uniref:Uncharacterized protein n=1 Tax=Handroanthus impetiginosus TaxID=429701 RepID=A0A2G9HD92_9LAMI|nr:hypothetical protein CDL12_11888 [Handroanthus impetiginosus]
MDPSPKPNASESGHVHCFSNTIVDDPHKMQENMISNPIYPLDNFAWGQFPPIRAPFPGPVSLQDPSVIRSFLANYGQIMNQGFEKEKEMVSVSQETTENSSAMSNVDMGKKVFEELDNPVGTQDLDCIWSY